MRGSSAHAASFRTRGLISAFSFSRPSLNCRRCKSLSSAKVYGERGVRSCWIVNQLSPYRLMAGGSSVHTTATQLGFYSPIFYFSRLFFPDCELLVTATVGETFLLPRFRFQPFTQMLRFAFTKVRSERLIAAPGYLGGFPAAFSFQKL